MSQESPELVTMRRALGQQLAALRDAAGIVQQQVAHRTGYSRSAVAKAESGRYLLPREFWTTADELLHADGTLLASYEQLHATKEQHDARTREAELARAYAEAQAHAQTLRASTPPDAQHTSGLIVPTGQEVLPSLIASVGANLAGGLAGPLLYLAFLSSTLNQAQAVPIEWRDQLHEQLAKFLHEWANTMERRKLLRLLGWTATTIAASPTNNLNTDEQERLTKAVAAPHRVDNQVIDHINTMLQHCKRQEDTLGPHAVLHTVIAQRELVNSLLDECPAEFRPRLLSVHSSMSSSIGYYFFDLDDPTSAMHYCDQARESAQEARNTELATYALCNMSYFASWQGKAHAGIDYAAAAQNLSGKTGDPLLRIYTAERAGSAYAVDGQYKESMTEFDRAMAGLALPTGQRSPDSTVYWVNEGFISCKKSDSLLRLGKPAEAAATAERGLQLIDSSFVSGVAFCTLRLGTARLLSGEINEAARLIGKGALHATKYRSARLTSEVTAARDRMRPWRDTPAVRDLDEQLTGLGLSCNAASPGKQD